MSDLPLISIILPTYNRAEYLPLAIESCLAQSYPSWELIIVDDASTDATPAIIGDYAARDARIRSIRHAANKQLPRALNTGFAASQGALLTWTSDDDLLLPPMLEQLVSQCERYPAADFVYADYEVIDASGKTMQTNSVPLPQECIFGDMRIACFLYRRRVYEQIGDYAEDLFLAEDFDYLLRMLNARCVMLPLHETLFQYRRHDRSLTDVYRGKTFAAGEHALLRNLPAMQWADRTLMTRTWLHLASLAIWQKAYIRAVPYIVRGMVLDPSRTMTKVTSVLQKRLAK